MTIYDIASEAGVSISTVSRVINSPEKVAVATRIKVQQILEKSNYYPNAMAQGLVNKSMKTIAVLMSDVRNLHFSTAAYVLERLFFKWGYSTLLCNTGDDLEKKKKYIRMLAGKKADGVVLVGSIFNESEIERIITDYMPDTPVVISNGSLSIPNSYSVLLDHNAGLEIAVGYLASKGHRRIGLVRSNISFNTKRKMAGFAGALKKHGLPVDQDENIFVTGPSVQGGLDFAAGFDRGGSDYTAFIFIDDQLALGAVNGFKQKGLRVPEDIAVIGHDNSIFARCTQPAITSVDTKIESMSVLVANTLNDIFNHKPVGNSILLRPELVVRESA